MKRAWPDLSLRARIQRRMKVGGALDAAAQKLQSLVQRVDELGLDEDEDDIEELAEHVRSCPNCKSILAKEARAGVYIPEKLLVAAGIEILRN
jgi:hypothetical protein